MKKLALSFVVAAIAGAILAVGLTSRAGDGGSREITTAVQGTPAASANRLASAPSPTPQIDLPELQGGTLHWGDAVRNVDSESSNICIRSDPRVDVSCAADVRGGSANWLGLLPPGSTGVVIDGPVDADGYRWWRIVTAESVDRETRSTPLVGWVTASDGSDTWLDAAADQGAPSGGWRVWYSESTGAVRGYAAAIHVAGARAALWVEGPGLPNGRMYAAHIANGEITTDGESCTNLRWVVAADAASLSGSFDGTGVAGCTSSGTVHGSRLAVRAAPAADPTPSPGAAPSRTPSDSVRPLLENGDFENGLDGWVLLTTPGCPAASSFGDVDKGSFHIVRTGSGACGGTVQITQELDLAVTAELELTLSVRVMSHNLCGGGRVDGKEAPVFVELQYLDSDGRSAGYWHGFYSNDGGCITDFVTKVDRDTWVEWRVDLEGLTPPMAQLLTVTIGGNGWSFESLVRDVSVTQRRP